MTPHIKPLIDPSSAALRVAALPTQVGQFDPTACPVCRTPLESLGFCPRDGAIGREGRFTIAGRYIADELLGAGERSFVYAAHRDGQPVAIKLLRDADTSSSSPAARKFLREARNASQLAHDNTIVIHEFGHDEALGVPFIAMELFAGQSLERVLRTSGPMAVARAVPILVQIARSLANAHMAGVLHRDVTARSVLIGRGDHIKVGDYGLGRADDASGSEADVLGFGRLAVAMLRGRTAAVPQAMLDKVSTTIPPDLHKLLAQCLDASVSARPRAQEIEERLLAVGTQPAAPVVVAPAPAPVMYAPPPQPVVYAPPPQPVVYAPPPQPVIVAPAPVPAPIVAIEAPIAPVAPESPAPTPLPPVDSLDDAEPSASMFAPRKRAWWIAGIALAAAALVTVIITLIVYATSGSSSSTLTTAARTDRAPTPPIAAASPPVQPEHAVVHEPPPPPPAPPPAPAAEPDPTPAPAPPPPKPAAVAAPSAPPSPPPAALAKKPKPKHKDDAVIADPFSD